MNVTRRSRRTYGEWFWVAAVLCVGLGGSSCRTGKPIRHYQPSVVQTTTGAEGVEPSRVIVAIEAFSAGAAYDETRIVYRKDPYRFDYYHYHRWAAPPGLMVSDILREVYRQTGRFQAVIDGYDTTSHVVLNGRVVQFEELDVDQNEWKARVTVHLQLRDTATGELLWSRRVTQTEPMKKQSPLGLSRAMSKALSQIGSETAGEIIEAARRSKRLTQ